MSDNAEFATPARAESARIDGSEHTVIRSVPMAETVLPPAPSRRRHDADADAGPQYRRSAAPETVDAPALAETPAPTDVPAPPADQPSRKQQRETRERRSFLQSD